MRTKEVEFHEVEIRFLVRKGSPGAESVGELLDNVANSIGGADMNGIDTEDETVTIDGKRLNLPWDK